nr:hypothetical protein Iba_chr12aCG22570 [Ipomoea batatas]
MDTNGRILPSRADIGPRYSREWWLAEVACGKGCETWLGDAWSHVWMRGFGARGTGIASIWYSKPDEYTISPTQLRPPAQTPPQSPAFGDGIAAAAAAAAVFWELVSAPVVGGSPAAPKGGIDSFFILAFSLSAASSLRLFSTFTTSSRSS